MSYRGDGINARPAWPDNRNAGRAFIFSIKLFCRDFGRMAPGIAQDQDPLSRNHNQSVSRLGPGRGSLSRLSHLAFSRKWRQANGSFVYVADLRVNTSTGWQQPAQRATQTTATGNTTRKAALQLCITGGAIPCLDQTLAMARAAIRSTTAGLHSGFNR